MQMTTHEDRAPLVSHVISQAEDPRNASTVLSSLRQYAPSSLPSLMPSSTRNAIINGVIGGKATSHVELRELIENASHSLGGRVGVALGGGPVAAACLLATIAGGCAIPLNSQHTEQELQSELLNTKATSVLVFDAERDSAAARAAHHLNLNVVVVAPVGTTAFRLDGGASTSLNKSVSGLDRAALLLHTSGTSGTRKVVPHTLEGLLTGAACVIASWDLRPTDVCLNFMPLNHVGGLVRNLLAPVLSGGAVVTCPHFDPTMFVQLVQSFSVTWYYSSPTMHDLFLAQSKSVGATIRLRLVANAAAALPHALAVKLRSTFHAVVLPSYGMTECMPISTPPTDYRLERPGTSGTSCGPEIAILGDDDEPLMTGQVGRICVRGPPLFAGYENNDEWNQAAFTSDGFFDTGDLGRLDDEGYLYITGRSKEVINRGGEIISPLEVEEVLAQCPQVEKVMAFAQPHKLLDDVVGIAIVPIHRDPAMVNLDDLRKFCNGKLHPSKWPELLVYMDTLPTNEVGKLQRVRYAARTGLTAQDAELPLARRHFDATCPTPGPLAMPISLKRRNAKYSSHDATPAMTEQAITSHAMQSLIGLIEDITGARARPNDRLSNLGFDSLLSLQLRTRLAEALGAAAESVDNALLLSNPSLKEICDAAFVDTHEKTVRNTAISLAAVMGLRSLACWEIIRAHGGRHFNEINRNGIICDANANDTATGWHTTIFIYLAGMQMAMQYDKATVSTTLLMSNFLASIIPIYYVSIALVLPIVEGVTPAIVTSALLVQLPIQGTGPAWFLFNLFWFNMFFNSIRFAVKYSWSCEGTQPYSSCCCPSLEDEEKSGDEEAPHRACLGCGCLICGHPICCKTHLSRPPPRTLCQFMNHFLKWGALATATNPIWNFLPPLRAGQFALGIVVGQGSFARSLATCNLWCGRSPSCRA